MNNQLHQALGSFVQAGSGGKPLEPSLQEAIESFLQKALNDPTQGGTLHPVHIIDRNGHHTIRYMSQAEVATAGQYNHLAEPLREGHRFSHPKNGPGTVTKVKGHDSKGYELAIKYDDGRKGTAYVQNVTLHPPTTDPLGAMYTQTQAKAGLVGYTKSGKEIYDNKGAAQHRNFTEADHMNAAGLYMGLKYGESGVKLNPKYQQQQLDHERLAGMDTEEQEPLTPQNPPEVTDFITNTLKPENVPVNVLNRDADYRYLQQLHGKDAWLARQDEKRQELKEKGIKPDEDGLIPIYLINRFKDPNERAESDYRLAEMMHDLTGYHGGTGGREYTTFQLQKNGLEVTEFAHELQPDGSFDKRNMTDSFAARCSCGHISWHHGEENFEDGTCSDCGYAQKLINRRSDTYHRKIFGR